MLDVGKLIHLGLSIHQNGSFSSILDAGKLIPYIGDIHFPLSLWYNMVNEIAE